MNRRNGDCPCMAKFGTPLCGACVPKGSHVETPWGSYAVLHADGTKKVKEIRVKSGHRLSYQWHERREERWVIVEGTAVVTIDGAVQSADKGSVVTIPRRAKHRIANGGEGELVFVEVQLGDYFGEDDIVRVEDDYGRGS